MRTLQTSQRFIVVSAALFFGSAALTVGWCGSMSALHGMSMCSGRTLTTPMSAAEFLGMWMAMMVAMMLPSLLPMLWRYRQVVIATTRLDALTACVGLGYFFVWAAFGVVAFAAESAMADMTTRWPMATGAIVLIAGALQFSRWKTHHLICCRAAPDCCGRWPAEVRTAWRHGLRLGAHCVHCCFGLTVVLLAVGVMDLRAMALVTAAISLERLAPGGLRVARFIGGILLTSGAFMIAHAMI
jgi:predicted metal-binding membrane protein